MNKLTLLVSFMCGKKSCGFELTVSFSTFEVLTPIVLSSHYILDKQLIVSYLKTASDNAMIRKMLITPNNETQVK